MNAHITAMTRPLTQWLCLACVLSLLSACGGASDNGEAPSNGGEGATSSGAEYGGSRVTTTNDPSLNITRRWNCEGVYIGRTFNRTNPDEVINYVFHVQSIQSDTEKRKLFAWYNPMIEAAGLDSTGIEILKNDYLEGFEFAGRPAQWQGYVFMGRFEGETLVLEDPKYWAISGGTNLMQQIGPEAEEEFGNRRFKHMPIGSCCDENMKTRVHWGEPRAGYPEADNGEMLFWRFGDLALVGGGFHASKFESLRDLTLEAFNKELDRLGIE